MKLSVHTIEKTFFDGEVDKLVVKTTTGEITVLDDHLPLVTLLIGPKIEYEQRGKRQEIPLKSGVLEVRPGSETIVLANS